jgi:hypothetical protein
VSLDSVTYCLCLLIIAGYHRRLISYIVHLKHSSCNAKKLALADRTLLYNNSMIVCVCVCVCRQHVIFEVQCFYRLLIQLFNS